MADFASTGQPRSIAAPLDGPSNPAVYVLPQGVAFDLQSVYAEIDATGAGATKATLTIRDSSGAVIARKRQGETVDAGSAGSATWALRLDDAKAGGTPGAGIAFDTDNQGGWLEVTTNNASPAGRGILFDDASLAGILVKLRQVALIFENLGGGLDGLRVDVGAANASRWQITVQNNAFECMRVDGNGFISFRLITNGRTFTVRNPGGGRVFEITAAAAGDLLQLGIVGSKVGFFGKAPVAQQATPVTLAQVIAMLKAYGLCP